MQYLCDFQVGLFATLVMPGCNRKVRIQVRGQSKCSDWGEAGERAGEREADTVQAQGTQIQRACVHTGYSWSASPSGAEPGPADPCGGPTCRCRAGKYSATRLTQHVTGWRRTRGAASAAGPPATCAAGWPAAQSHPPAAPAAALPGPAAPLADPRPASRECGAGRRQSEMAES